MFLILSKTTDSNAYFSTKNYCLYPEYLLEDRVECVLFHFCFPLASLTPVDIRINIIFSANITIMTIVPVDIRIIMIDLNE